METEETDLTSGLTVHFGIALGRFCLNIPVDEVLQLAARQAKQKGMAVANTDQFLGNLGHLLSSPHTENGQQILKSLLNHLVVEMIEHAPSECGFGRLQ